MRITRNNRRYELSENVLGLLQISPDLKPCGNSAVQALVHIDRDWRAPFRRTPAAGENHAPAKRTARVAARHLRALSAETNGSNAGEV
jgi:hypothetical protein